MIETSVRVTFTFKWTQYLLFIYLIILKYANITPMWIPNFSKILPKSIGYSPNPLNGAYLIRATPTRKRGLICLIDKPCNGLPTVLLIFGIAHFDQTTNVILALAAFLICRYINIGNIVE